MHSAAKFALNASMALGFFRKIRQNISRTTAKFFGFAGRIFIPKTLSPEALEQLESDLYGADLGIQTTREILEALRKFVRENRALAKEEIGAIAREVLKNELLQSEGQISRLNHSPEVICLVGINGSGKTTTAAKLAAYFQREGKSVLLGAGDTFRAAANEQIEIWAQRLGVDLIRSQHGADSAAVAFDAVSAAIARHIDVLILDTAGRLHTKSNLMDELAKLKRVIQKKLPAAPHHCWFVVDGSLGSNSIEQAKVFHEKLGLTGIIITKLDGSSRGGTLVGIHRQLQLPIYFIGTGERPEDLHPFSRDEYLSALFF